MQNEGTRSTPARRVNVKGRRGIYYREGKDGQRRYEITYRDSTGKQRWKVVPGGLKEAEAALEDVRRKIRMGERVAPSRVTFAEVAAQWFESQTTQLRPRTIDAYRSALDNHLLPHFGTRQIGQINEEDIARFIAKLSRPNAKRENGYAGWSIRASLTPLGRILGYAARRGMIGSNPMDRLERGERPKVADGEMQILTREEIAEAVKPSDDPPVLATAIFTGLRLGELLGLTWADIDFEAGRVHVRKQLDREGQRVDPKTRQAKRSVVLMPTLGKTLREHRVASPRSQDPDFVFPAADGGGLDHSTPRAILKRALKAGGIERADGKALRFHDLRHTAASLLIAQGANVVFVSRQLGHASADITLKRYAHLFDGAEHADRMSAALEAGFGGLLIPANGG